MVSIILRTVFSLMTRPELLLLIRCLRFFNLKLC